MADKTGVRECVSGMMHGGRGTERRWNTGRENEEYERMMANERKRKEEGEGERERGKKGPRGTNEDSVFEGTRRKLVMVMRRCNDSRYLALL